jgi:hypothetical protein
MNTLAIFVKDFFSLSSQASEGVTYALIGAITLIVVTWFLVSAWIKRRHPQRRKFLLFVW